jgi:hypothetical protein
MNNRDETIFKLGMAHAAQGLARYKFQDPYLQNLYNKGYDGGDEVASTLKVRLCEMCGRPTHSTKQRYCATCRY